MASGTVGQQPNTDIVTDGETSVDDSNRDIENVSVTINITQNSRGVRGVDVDCGEPKAEKGVGETGTPGTHINDDARFVQVTINVN